MSDSTEELDETPTMSEEKAEEEGKKLTQGLIRVAVVSILSLLLITTGLLQASGVVDLFPFGEGWTVQWLVFVLLALILIGIEVWGWKS